MPKIKVTWKTFTVDEYSGFYEYGDLREVSKCEFGGDGLPSIDEIGGRKYVDRYCEHRSFGELDHFLATEENNMHLPDYSGAGNRMIVSLEIVEG